VTIVNMRDLELFLIAIETDLKKGTIWNQRLRDN